MINHVNIIRYYVSYVMLFGVAFCPFPLKKRKLFSCCVFDGVTHTHFGKIKNPLTIKYMKNLKKNLDYTKYKSRTSANKTKLLVYFLARTNIII